MNRINPLLKEDFVVKDAVNFEMFVRKILALVSNACRYCDFSSAQIKAAGGMLFELNIKPPSKLRLVCINTETKE